MVRRLSGSGRTIEILLAGLSLAIAPLNAAAQSGMSKAEGAQLYSAAGFSILNEMPVNRCGKPARPRVTLVDINGDKRPEALFVDTDAACYTKSGHYFAVLVKEGTTWRSVISGTGAIQALSSNTNGWLNMRVTDSGCVRDHHYDGRTYKAVSSCTGETVATAPQTAQPVPSASPGKTAGTSLAAADATAAFKAAGFSRRGNAWRSTCEDPGTTSYSQDRNSGD